MNTEKVVNTIKRMRAANMGYNKPYLWWVSLTEKKKGILIRRFGQNISTYDLYKNTH